MLAMGMEGIHAKLLSLNQSPRTQGEQRPFDIWYLRLACLEDVQTEMDQISSDSRIHCDRDEWHEWGWKREFPRESKFRLTG